MSYMCKLLYSQLFGNLPYPKSDFKDQVIIVTGSNTGLGYEAVKHLLRLGVAKVILAVRNTEKGDDARNYLVNECICDPARIEVWLLNLANFESIRNFGERVKTLPRLDAVIQNAGILTYEWKVEEGYESHVAVNVLGAVLLGLNVLPKLRETAAATGMTGRLSFVGSDMMLIAKFEELKKAETGVLVAAMCDENISNIQDRYGTSKLFLFVLVRALAKMSPLGPTSNVVINDCSPGACKTNIFRDDMGWMKKMAMSVMIGMMARSAKYGSRELINAIKPEIEREAHGKFLWNCEIADPGPHFDSSNAANDAWHEQLVEEVFRIMEEIQPGVTQNATPSN
ncbi:NAD(P)-binding protein [Aulographum hederae CBS 113979]|uniref:NAD(P)-binding protein n=1 Tax=Aulographum hederae CBS 113979 TaxID=1176131 RepID=A0A6G1HAT4_9PEZI|nr:NAD(P)-binding protein [Aulographum hederae CBS 113979]